MKRIDDLETYTEALGFKFFLSGAEP